MYCDGCGTEIIPGQNFCRACGRPLTGIPVGPAHSRIEGHIRLLGILWLANSCLHLIPGLFLLGFGSFFVHLGSLPHFVVPLMGFIGGLVMLSSVLGIVAGWGLLERQLWARSLVLVLGCLSLFHPPLGTALGIYTLWVLWSTDSEIEYRRIARV